MSRFEEVKKIADEKYETISNEETVKCVSTIIKR